MTLSFPIDTRRIIPRWRDSRIAIAMGELVIPRTTPPEPIRADSNFLDKKNLWKLSNQIEFAAELVASALSQGLLTEGLDAAEFILDNQDKTTRAIAVVAEELLMRAGKRDAKSRIEAEPEVTEVKQLYLRIHTLRNSLNNYPNNALLWVDLSHAYALLGQLQKSRETMTNALYLAPNNRFVLRSAARLFVHLDEPDYAHRILIEKPVTRQDPWLLAAEIATATVAESTSPLIRHSRTILYNGPFKPYHIAELASALASVELAKGSSRNARKLFETSLIDPTENSVAQSVWAKRWLGSLDVGKAIQFTPRTYEAQTWNSFFASDWSKLLNFASNWLADEPFSSRPAIFGSYVASVALEDFETAENFSRRGIRANPSDYALINNLAFSLAKQNELEEANELISNLSRPASDVSHEIALEATEGLIHIRRGDIVRGKAKYLNAIELSRLNSMPNLRALASINYAQEMLRVGDVEYSNAVGIAAEALKKVSEPEVHSLFKKLIKSLE